MRGVVCGDEYLHRAPTDGFGYRRQFVRERIWSSLELGARQLNDRRQCSLAGLAVERRPVAVIDQRARAFQRKRLCHPPCRQWSELQRKRCFSPLALVVDTCGGCSADGSAGALQVVASREGAPRGGRWARERRERTSARHLRGRCAAFEAAAVVPHPVALSIVGIGCLRAKDDTHPASNRRLT